MITYTVKSAKNGWIFEAKYDDGETTHIVGREAEDEIESFIEFLYDIEDNFGPTAGKYDKKRIRIVALPGQNYIGPLDDDYITRLSRLKEDIESALGIVSGSNDKLMDLVRAVKGFRDHGEAKNSPHAQVMFKALEAVEEII